MDDLSKSIADLASVVGRSKALILAGHCCSIRNNVRQKRGDNYGNDCLYIPTERNLSEDHLLAKLIGIYSARKLSRFNGGILLHISGCRSIYINYRNEQIALMSDQGTDRKVIARLLGLTDRHVYSIIKQRS